MLTFQRFSKKSEDYSEPPRIQSETIFKAVMHSICDILFYEILFCYEIIFFEGVSVKKNKIMHFLECSTALKHKRSF